MYRGGNVWDCHLRARIELLVDWTLHAFSHRIRSFFAGCRSPLFMVNQPIADDIGVFRNSLD